MQADWKIQNSGSGASENFWICRVLQVLIDDRSTLVQAMAWCYQVPRHYQNQWWPRSTAMIISIFIFSSLCGIKPLLKPMLTSHQLCVRRHSNIKFKLLLSVNPQTTGKPWVHNHHCSYWCLSAGAPSHQYLQGWPNILCGRPVSYRHNAAIGDNINKLICILKKTNIQLFKR